MAASHSSQYFAPHSLQNELATTSSASSQLEHTGNCEHDKENDNERQQQQVKRSTKNHDRMKVWKPENIRWGTENKRKLSYIAITA
jgi:hypothetical protein